MVVVMVNWNAPSPMAESIPEYRLKGVLFKMIPIIHKGPSKYFICNAGRDYSDDFAYDCFWHGSPKNSLNIA